MVLSLPLPAAYKFLPDCRAPPGRKRNGHNYSVLGDHQGEKRPSSAETCAAYGSPAPWLASFCASHPSTRPPFPPTSAPWRRRGAGQNGVASRPHHHIGTSAANWRQQGWLVAFGLLPLPCFDRWRDWLRARGPEASRPAEKSPPRLSHDNPRHREASRPNGSVSVGAIPRSPTLSFHIFSQLDGPPGARPVPLLVSATVWSASGRDCTGQGQTDTAITMACTTTSLRALLSMCTHAHIHTPGRPHTHSVISPLGSF